MKILLVEDSETQAGWMAEVLRHLTHTVWRVGDGEAALGLLATHDFDAMILDLQLPGMHGTEVMRRLKVLDRIPPMVIAATAGTGQSLLSIADEFNCKILRKPFSTDQLSRMLEKGY